MDNLAARTSSVSSNNEGTEALNLCEESATTIQNLRVFKEVCHRIRSSLLEGKNEIVSPTSISKVLVKENVDKDSVSPSNGAHVGSKEGVAMEESCPFLEPAEGWTIEYSAGGCEVSFIKLPIKKNL